MGVYVRDMATTDREVQLSTQRAKRKTANSSSKKDSCCPEQKAHPDHRATLSRLNRIRGQIDGIERMIGDQRYCVDILVQFKAVSSALRAIESSIFETHVRSCVKDAARVKNKTEMDRKIEELMGLIFK